MKLYVSLFILFVFNKQDYFIVIVIVIDIHSHNIMVDYIVVNAISNICINKKQTSS